jgi:cytochrome c oxidase subunit IV
MSGVTNLDEHADSHHIISPGTYLVIIVSLMVLTLATVFAAFVDMGRYNIVAALGIATVKASLVVLFFMHAKYSPKRTQLVILAGIFWLGLLLFMTMGDYETRVDYRGVKYPMTQLIVHGSGQNS